MNRTNEETHAQPGGREPIALPHCPACGTRARRTGAHFCATCGRGLRERAYAPADSLFASYHQQRHRPPMLFDSVAATSVRPRAPRRVAARVQQRGQHFGGHRARARLVGARAFHRHPLQPARRVRRRPRPLRGVARAACGRRPARRLLHRFRLFDRGRAGLAFSTHLNGKPPSSRISYRPDATATRVSRYRLEQLTTDNSRIFK